MLSHNAPPRKWLLKIEAHSFPAVSRLEFCSHFLEGVRTIFAVYNYGDSSNHSFAFIGATCVNGRTIKIVAPIFLKVLVPFLHYIIMVTPPITALLLSVPHV